MRNNYAVRSSVPRREHEEQSHYLFLEKESAECAYHSHGQEPCMVEIPYYSRVMAIIAFTHWPSITF